jgi:serine/threonine protein kinase
MGNAPRTQAYDHNDRVHEAIASYEEAQDVGDEPDPQDWIGRYPEVAGRLAEFFAARKGLQQLATPLLPVTAQAHHELPPCIGKYRVVQRLGGGGQGEVFRAVNPDLPGRDVVIKWARADVSEGRRQQLLDEGRVLAGLDEPGVVRVYDVGVHDGRPFVVLEHVAGRSLEQIHRQRPPTAREAALLVAQLAGILDRVHQHDILHRDLKPANVLIDPTGRPRLIDFGLAWRQEFGGGLESQRSGVCGTFAYMAPEQARGQAEHIGPRTDVFGLGTVLYELLTGRRPYRGPDRTTVWDQAKRGQVTPPRQLNPRIPRALDRICRKALAPDPAERYASAGEMARAIRRYLWSRRLLVPAVGLALAIVLGLLLWRPWDNPPPGPAINRGTALPAPLLVKKLRVIHLQETPKAFVGREVGADVFSTRFDDKVQVHVEFSEPVYAFLLAFNPDGREQPCLPADPANPPELHDRLDYPGAGRAFVLNDAVGLQAFVVVASRQPLPAYDECKARRPALRWQTLPAKEGAVWRGDGERLYLVTRGGDPRGQVVELPEVAPLRDLCQALRAAPEVEVLAAEAFAVLPMAGK